MAPKKAAAPPAKKPTRAAPKKSAPPPATRRSTRSKDTSDEKTENEHALEQEAPKAAPRRKVTKASTDEPTPVEPEAPAKTTKQTRGRKKVEPIEINEEDREATAVAAKPRATRRTNKRSAEEDQDLQLEEQPQEPPKKRTRRGKESNRKEEEEETAEAEPETASERPKAQRGRRNPKKEEVEEAPEPAKEALDAEQEATIEDEQTDAAKATGRPPRKSKRAAQPAEPELALDEPKEPVETEPIVDVIAKTTKPRGRPKKARGGKAPAEEQIAESHDAADSAQVADEDTEKGYEKAVPAPKVTKQRGRKRQTKQETDQPQDSDIVMAEDGTKDGPEIEGVTAEPEETTKVSKTKKAKAPARTTRSRAKSPLAQKPVERSQLPETKEPELVPKEPAEPAPSKQLRRGRGAKAATTKKAENQEQAMAPTENTSQEEQTAASTGEQDISEAAQPETQKKSTKARKTRVAKKTTRGTKADSEVVTKDAGLEVAETAEDGEDEREPKSTGANVSGSEVQSEQHGTSDITKPAFNLKNGQIEDENDTSNHNIMETPIQEEESNYNENIDTAMQIDALMENSEAQVVDTQPNSPLEPNDPPTTPKSKEDTNMSGTEEIKSSKRTRAPSLAGEKPGDTPSRKKFKAPDGSLKDITESLVSTTDLGQVSSSAKPLKSSRNRKSYPAAIRNKTQERLASPQSAPRVKKAVETLVLEESCQSPSLQRQSESQILEATATGSLSPQFGQSPTTSHAFESPAMSSPYATVSALGQRSPMPHHVAETDESAAKVNVVDVSASPELQGVEFAQPVTPSIHGALDSGVSEGSAGKSDENFQAAADNTLPFPADGETAENEISPFKKHSFRATLELAHASPSVTQQITMNNSPLANTSPNTPATEGYAHQVPATPQGANSQASPLQVNNPGEGTILMEYIGGLEPSEFNNDGDTTAYEKLKQFESKYRPGAPEATEGQTPQQQTLGYMLGSPGGPLAASTPLMSRANYPSINNRHIEGDVDFAQALEGYSQLDETSIDRTQDYPESDDDDDVDNMQIDDEEETCAIASMQTTRLSLSQRLGKQRTLNQAQGTPLTTRVSDSPGIAAVSLAPQLPKTPNASSPAVNLTGFIDSALCNSLFGDSPGSIKFGTPNTHGTPNTNLTPQIAQGTPMLPPSMAGTPAHFNNSLADTTGGSLVIEENGMDDPDISALNPYEARVVYNRHRQDVKKITTSIASPKKRNATYKGSQTPQANSKPRKVPRQSLPAKLTGFHQKLLRSATKSHLPGSPLKQCETVDGHTAGSPQRKNITTMPGRRTSRNMDIESPISTAKRISGTSKNLGLSRLQQDLQEADESVISELNDAELDWLSNDVEESPLKSLGTPGASITASNNTPKSTRRTRSSSTPRAVETPRRKSTPRAANSPAAVHHLGLLEETSGLESLPDKSSPLFHNTPIISQSIADESALSDPVSPSPISRDESYTTTDIVSYAGTVLFEAEDVLLEADAVEPSSPTSESETSTAEEDCLLSTTVVIREVMSQLDPIPEADSKRDRKHKFQNKQPSVRHSINTLPTPSADSPPPRSDSVTRKSARRKTLSGEIKLGHPNQRNPKQTRLSDLDSPLTVAEPDVLAEEVKFDTPEEPDLPTDQEEQTLEEEEEQSPETEDVENSGARDDFLDEFIAKFHAKKAARAEEEEQHIADGGGSPAKSIPSSSPKKQGSSPNVKDMDVAVSLSSPLRRSPRAAAVAESRPQSTTIDATFRAGQTPKSTSRSQKISSLPVLSGKGKLGRPKGSKSKSSAFSAPPPLLDLSILVSPAPGEPPTLSQLAPRELAKMTAKNTTVNALWENVTFEREVFQRDIPRPPSPNGKRQTILANDLRRKRKAIEDETGIVLGPGDELDFVPRKISPSRKRVKWDGQLEAGREEDLPRVSPKPVPGHARRGVLKEPKADLGPEQAAPLSTIKVVRYLYLGEKDEYS